MNPKVIISTAQSDERLSQMLQLQQDNLPGVISVEEAKEQGFVSVTHDLDLLRAMNEPYPHIVALDEDKIVGYTLVMLKKMRTTVPILISMFDIIDQCRYNDEILQDTDYFVMGQVCIAKGYRGQGIFSRLYQGLKDQMRPHFRYLVTEVAKKNTRSMRAHAKVGFEIIKEYRSDDIDWAVVIMPLK